MFYVKRVCPAMGNHQPTKVGGMFKNLSAAQKLAAQHVAAVVIEQATGKFVSYGKGGLLAWHKMA